MTPGGYIRIPNALNTREPLLPLPAPFDRTLSEAAVLMALLFGFLGVIAVDLVTSRPYGPDINLFAYVAITIIVLTFVRIAGRSIPYWTWLMFRHAGFRILGRLSWGLIPTNVGREIMAGGPGAKRAVILSGTWAKLLYSNVRVTESGAFDVSGLPLPTLLRRLTSFFKGESGLRQTIEVACTGMTDLSDISTQNAIHISRTRFWYKLGQRASAHIQIQPLDPETIAYSAGPEEAAARALALGTGDGMQQGLIQRRAFLTVQAPIQFLLDRNVRKAVALLDGFGRRPRVLGADESRLLTADVFGKTPLPVEIAPTYIRIGARRFVSYLITKLDREVPLNWLPQIINGSSGARVAVYSTPIGSRSARTMLRFKQMFWQGASVAVGSDDYVNAVKDAIDVREEIREPAGALHRFSMVVTVPEEEKETIEDALQTSRVADEDGWRPMIGAQDAGLKASQPFGIAAHLDERLISSSGLGAIDVWSSSSIWRPGSVLVGVSLISPEPIGWDPFDETQDAWNLFVWGLMGAGKSNTIEALMRRICKPHPKHYLAELKPRLLAIDHKPDLEYAPLIADLDGEYVVLDDRGGQRQLWETVRSLNVEQRALGINFARVHPKIRGKLVYDVVRTLQDKLSRRPKNSPWPGVLGNDEMSMLALSEDGRLAIHETAKLLRSSWVSCMYGTQQMDDVLQRDNTAGSDTDGLVAAAIKNASTRIALRQSPLDRRQLQSRLEMPSVVCDMLEHVGDQDEITYKGQGVIWAHGRMAPVQVVRLGEEVNLLSMNPQERYRRFGHLDPAATLERKEEIPNDFYRSNHPAGTASRRASRRIPGRQPATVRRSFRKSDGS